MWSWTLLSSFLHYPSGLQKPALATRVEALSISVDSSDVEVAQDVASKLHEEKMDLILRVVQILGRPAAIRLFEEARQIENHDGGILTAVSPLELLFLF